MGAIMYSVCLGLRRSALLWILLAMPPVWAGPAPGGDGLLGTYYDQNGQQRQYFTGNTYQRIDPTVNFNWGGGAPAPGIGTDDFSIRWTGEVLTVNQNGCYQFRTNSDDGVRLWIAGNLVIDNWTDHAPTFDTSSCVNLNRNTRYAIQLEYYERGGGAVIELYWDTPGGPSNFQIIPQTNLFSGVSPQVVSVVNPGSTSALCGDLSLLEVTYNIPMRSGGPNGADRQQNYDIPGGPNVNGATLSADGLTVTLTLNQPLVSGASYTLEVRNVASAGGTLIDPNPTNFNFTAQSGVLTAGGLKGTYYDQNGVQRAYFTGSSNTRVDGPVAFDVGNGSFWPGTVPTDLFSVRWEGFVRPDTSWWYRFVTITDDGVRLWINGTLVIDNWTDHGSTTDYSSYVFLDSSTYYQVRLEFYEHFGQAEMQLGWQPWNGSASLIPAANLYSCQTTATTTGFQIAVGTTNASTCAPLTVDISALRSNGTVNTGYNGTVQITTSSAHGDWVNVDGVGVFDNGAPDDGAALYEFAPGGGGDAGTVQLQLNNVHADDLTISVEDIGDPTTLSTSVLVSFRDNAFVVTENDALDSIGVAGRPHAYLIQQVRRDSGGQCGINTNYQGSIGLKAWVSRDGLDPGGAAPSIGGTPLPNATPAGNNLTLNFTAGEAVFNLDTTDVGKYGLNFIDDTSGFAVDASNNPRPIAGGTTAAHTSRPFGFRFSGGFAADAGGAGAAFARAGENFSLTLTALQWQAADDGNGDGHPDGHELLDTNRSNDADLSDNPAATAYDWETGLQAVNPVGPSGGALGAFSGGPAAQGSFTNGAATVSSLQYLEAGEVSFYAELVGDYLGTAGATAHSRSPLVGRFVPFQYAVNVTQQACSSGGFTYSGQPVGEVTVTGQNSGGATTTNYTGAWSRGFDFTVDPTLAAVTAGATVADGQFVAGVATLTGQPTVTLNDKEADPAVNSLDLELDPASTELSAPTAVPGTIQIRAGRSVLVDAVGSELLPIQMPFRVEHWTGPGTGWQVHAADDCTAIGDFSYTLLNNTAGTSVNQASSSLVNGDGYIHLDAPGSVGHADLRAGSPAWLQYDWDGDGMHDDDPEARATFGAYKGDDNVIYRREQY